MQMAPLRALIALVLAGLTLCGAGFGPQRTSGSGAGKAAAGGLQEVAPPGAVVQVTQRLEDRNPVVEVLSPADEALLPEGPWTLKVRVRDWPMTAAAAVELGPHLMVQLDQNEPQHLRPASGDSDTISAPMPALEPGSHRLTVYAARAWGEAVKSPGAMRQIRLHRVARNPSQLPLKGTAQLIVASPDALQHEEPVLIDWLLLDAPLQHLRDDDARWRLRVSVNGDSVLVDRQTPLWLKGFHRGSNAVLLELLDDHGEPLNAPFNSVVREVTIGADSPTTWQRSTLSDDALALLSGAPPSQGPVEAEPEPTPEPEHKPEPAPPSVDQPGETAAVNQPGPPAAAAVTAETGEAGESSTTDQPGPAGGASGTVAVQEDEEPEQAPAAQAEESADGDRQPDAPVTAPAPAAPAAAEPDHEDPAAETSGTGPPSPGAAPAVPRVTAGSSLGGSARDQVNADGSLLQPQRRSPLAGLREKLGG